MIDPKQIAKVFVMTHLHIFQVPGRLPDLDQVPESAKEKFAQWLLKRQASAYVLFKDKYHDSIARLCKLNGEVLYLLATGRVSLDLANDIIQENNVDDAHPDLLEFEMLLMDYMVDSRTPSNREKLVQMLEELTTSINFQPGTADRVMHIFENINEDYPEITGDISLAASGTLSDIPKLLEKMKLTKDDYNVKVMRRIDDQN